MEKPANSAARRLGGSTARNQGLVRRVASNHGVGLVVTAAVLLVVVMSLGGVQRLNWHADNGRAPPSVIPAAPVEPSALDAPESGPTTPFSRQALGHSMRFVPEPVLGPPFEPLSATRFSAGPVAITLAGVDGPKRLAVCLDSARLKWACGLHARAALSKLLHQPRISCRRVPVPQEAAPPGPEGAILADCTIGGQDLATEIIRQGFARPVGFVGTGRTRALEAARREGLGLWNGDWTILP